MKTLTLLLAICLSLPAVAQVAPPSDAPASKEQIQKLFTVMDISKQTRLAMVSMERQTQATTTEALKARYPRITPAQLERVQRISEESMKAFPVDAMLDDMIPVYQKYLTQTDVDAMIAFYSSPTGKKLMQDMPQMMQEALQASNVRMQKHMAAAMERVDAMMKEEEQKQQSAPAPAPPSKPN
ncbi:MAG: DUF2059 domain-containing protein [Terriglobales bacterium]